MGSTDICYSTWARGVGDKMGRISQEVGRCTDSLQYSFRGNSLFSIRSRCAFSGNESCPIASKCFSLFQNSTEPWPSDSHRSMHLAILPWHALRTGKPSPRHRITKIFGLLPSTLRLHTRTKTQQKRRKIWRTVSQVRTNKEWYWIEKRR